jgi:zeaxanthin glucosyltransferase
VSSRPSAIASSRRRISFIPAPIGSHLRVCMGVARRLQAMGHAVEFLGDDTVASFAHNEGAGFRRLHGMWSMRPADIEMPEDPLRRPAELARCFRVRRQWRSRLRGAVTQVGDAIDGLLRDQPPDLVIFDPFRLAYYPLFHRRNIRGVVLSSKPLAAFDPAVPPQTSTLAPGPRFYRMLVKFSWLRLRGLDLVNRLMGGLASLAGIYVYNDLVRAVAYLANFPLRGEWARRGLWYDVHFRCVPEWALWTPALDFPRSKPLPSNIRYIGPCVDLQRREPALPVQRRPETRCLIYVAVGTAAGFAWREDVSFLSKVMRAFKDEADVEVWLSTGDVRVSKALGRPPANVRLLEFLPQLQVLDEADLAITHAGAGTMRECIMKGVPMLAYPRDSDQFGNAARIGYFGLGLRGERRHDDAAAIRRKAMQIRADCRFRDRLHAMRAEIEHGESDLLAAALADVLSRPAEPSMP